jgi:hypothetical protein
MQHWAIGYVATLVVVLASCGAGTHAPSATTAPTTGSPSAAATLATSPTPTPAPANTLAACATAAQPTPTSAAAGPTVAVLNQNVNPQVLELVDASGEMLNQTSVGQVSSSGADIGSNPLGVGPAGAYLYNSTSGEVSLLGLTGEPEVIGQVTLASQFDDVGFAVSPSGRCWILSDTSYDSSGDGTSRLYVAVDGASPALLTTLTRPAMVNGGFGGGYRVLSWDPSGVLLGTDPTGVGGAGPFLNDDYTLATVVRLDPLTVTLSSPLCTTGRFGDVAPDGAVACVTGEGSDAEIAVTPFQGSPSSIDTGIKLAGHVQFVDGSSLLTYCTSDENPAADGAGWTEELWTVDVGTPATSPSLVMSGDNSWCEDGVVAGADSLALPTGTGPGGTPSIEILDLTTGRATATIASASAVCGVL